MAQNLDNSVISTPFEINLEDEEYDQPLDLSIKRRPPPYSDNDVMKSTTIDSSINNEHEGNSHCRSTVIAYAPRSSTSSSSSCPPLSFRYKTVNDLSSSSQKIQWKHTVFSEDFRSMVDEHCRRPSSDNFGHASFVRISTKNIDQAVNDHFIRSLAITLAKKSENGSMMSLGQVGKGDQVDDINGKIF